MLAQDPARDMAHGEQDMKTRTSAVIGCVVTAIAARAGTLAYEQGPITPGVGPAVPYLATGEHGDDIQWDPRLVQPYAFTFAYHANFDQPNGMILRLYDQDGPRVGGKPSPGTVLWQDFVDVRSGGGEVTIPLGEDFWAKAPPQLVFAVDFGKLAQGHVAGLYAAGGPVAEGYRDARYWQRDCNTCGEWGLVKFEGLTTASAEFVASVKVVHLPEPSTWAMAGLGAVTWCIAGWRGRRTTAGSRHEGSASG